MLLAILPRITAIISPLAPLHPLALASLGLVVIVIGALVTFGGRRRP